MARLNFDGLRKLHDSVNGLLHSPKMKTTIAHHGQEKWVDEISEASLRMLETCGNTRDVLLLVKDHLQGLQSTFRRVGVACGIKFSRHSLERKKLKKAALRRRLNSFKEMKKNKRVNFRLDSSSSSSIMNQNLVGVINVLREVRVATLGIVESLVSLMSMPGPNRPKSCKGLFEYSKLTRADSLSSWEKCDAGALQEASRRLEAVEMDVEDLEQELDCIFRRLIETRVSLLNILTAH